MTSREAIFAALFAQLTAAQSTYVSPVVVNPFVTKSRKLAHWADVQPSQMPALYQSEKKQVITQTGRLPNKQVLTADLYLYVSQDQPNASGPSLTQSDCLQTTYLNNCIDAVFALLQAAPDSGTNQLGNPPLVTDCRIVGEIETDEGTLGNKAVAILTVEIVATL